MMKKNITLLFLCCFVSVLQAQTKQEVAKNRYQVQTKTIVLNVPSLDFTPPVLLLKIDGKEYSAEKEIVVSKPNLMADLFVATAGIVLNEKVWVDGEPYDSYVENYKKIVAKEQKKTALSIPNNNNEILSYTAKSIVPPKMPQVDIVPIDVDENQFQIDKLLEIGTNKITIKVENGLGLVQKRTFTIVYKPVLYIVSIGINDYENIGRNLKYAVADVQAMEKAFTRKHKNLYAEIVRFHYFEEQATQANLAHFFQDSLHLFKQNNRIYPADRFLVLFSGHGYLNSSNDFYFATVNSDGRTPSTGLGGYILTKSLSNLPCEVIVVVDACFGGEIINFKLGEGNTLISAAKGETYEGVWGPKGKKLKHKGGALSATIYEGLTTNVGRKSKNTTINKVDLLQYVKVQLPRNTRDKLDEAQKSNIKTEPIKNAKQAVERIPLVMDNK